MARGLEVLARLSMMEGNPALSVQLAGAMTALRAQAHLPPVPGARTQRFLDAAADLGEQAIRRLWAEGEAMTPTGAVRLALGAHASSLAPPRPALHLPAGPADPAHPARARGGRVARSGPQQPGYRREALHQPGDRRPPRR